VDAHGRVEIERRLDGAAWLVTLHGDYDQAVRPTLDQALSVVGRASRIIVDLSPARFIDSSVLAALLRHARPGPNGGDRLVIVAQPGGFPRRLLDLSQVGRHVRIFDTPEAALRKVVRPRREQAPTVFS